MIDDAASEHHRHGGEIDDAGSIWVPTRRRQTVAGVSRRAVLGGALLGAAGLATGVAGTPLARGWLGLNRLPVSGGYAASADHLEAVANPGVSIHYYGQTTEPVVAFTFDDGPRPQWTPMVLDVLDEYRVPATFFLQGANLRAHGDLVRGRLGRHAVGNHSWSHPDFATMDLTAVQRELTRTHDEIVRVTGQWPALMRPPYGHLGGSTLLAADCLGYDVVLWSQQMHEATYVRRPDLQVREIVRTVRPGSIVLAHDVGNATRPVALWHLGQMFTGIRARGLRFVTVPELLALGRPAGRVT
jgi:peptidoglycan/xylan/chitin deacetylase (PgdA/CDA1 family)